MTIYIQSVYLIFIFYKFFVAFSGAKGSTFEGGIRTPAIIAGGYFESECEDMIGDTYDNMVHITDWYAIIEHLAGVKGTKNEDIDGINLWPSICGKKQGKDEDEEATKREEIQYFVMNNVENIEEGYGPSYIRTNEWKLLINASLRLDGNKAYQYWVNYDNSFQPHPPKKLYDKIKGENIGLYESQCFDKYLMDDMKLHDNELDVEGTLFEYDEIMLFRINEDKVEACNLAKLYPKVLYSHISIFPALFDIFSHIFYFINRLWSI